MKLLQTSQAMPHFPIAGRSRIRCLSPRIIAACLGAASSCLIEPQTWAQGKEVMYSLDLSANARILTIDPQSGAIIRSTLLSPTIVTQTGLAWDGNRLLIKGNTNWLMDRLVVCHPADGYTNHLGAIGAQWYLIGVDFDPTTSTVRVAP